MRFVFGISLALFVGSAAVASSGLVIHTAEFGVGKFHRQDNQVHAHSASNAWSVYILAQGAATDKALVQDNADGSVTVFYQTLEELMSSVVQLSKDRGQPVAVLNVHGHGLPGAMWFPSDAATLQSSQCNSWRTAASGSDQANYDQYYHPVSASDVQQIRMIANFPGLAMAGCTTGLKEWKAVLAKVPAFKQALASDVQIHFLSCVVGLGKAGQQFSEGLATLLLAPGSPARIETATAFGLGDWSMPEGMGFWDMQSQAQVDRDSKIYAANKRDRDIAQKAAVRIAQAGSTSNLMADQEFMPLGFVREMSGTVVPEIQPEISGPIPSRVRIPGTTVYVDVVR
jgi:hypothetical protein